MNNKQRLLIITTILTITILLVATSTSYTPTQQTDKLQVVATFYPLAFFTEQIGGEHVQVTQLVPSNTEIHNWEPSPQDITNTETADIIIYNGAGLDHWMEDEILPALTTTKTRTTIDTTADLPLLHATETEEADQHDHGDYDPHTWISPYMAKLQAEKIYNALVQQDPTHETYYTDNWETLKASLEQIDANYTQTLANKQKNTIFVSHEAYGYLADRYNFTQHGVIGLSADQQPSAAAIANIITLMQQHQTYVVYVDPVYSQEYAQTLKNELETQTGKTVTILKLYLATGPADGNNYLQQQLLNLETLKTGIEAQPPQP
ncbi:zinc ABC transporter substrate-binding protein [Candidatus Bathyarchaeota archaeon]|nr:zinc ABC transporter substrate-binding protein [Candidatus Bathyarchaeota archaeon]